MPLGHIINCSLLTGIVTSKFIILRLVLIVKNDKCDDPCNYHPLPVLSNFSKIMEKQIAYRLFTFLKNNILYEHQFGFTPGKNATHAILLPVDYIINS